MKKIKQLYYKLRNYFFLPIKDSVFNKNKLALRQLGDIEAVCTRRNHLSKSYVFSIVNSTDKELEAVILGASDNLLEPNFGNPEGIEVTTLAPNTTYKRLLIQSIFQPFEIWLWRITAQSIDQLKEVCTFNYVDANGRSAADPICFWDFYDEAQCQKLIIEGEYPVIFTGNTSIKIPILPKSQIIVNMFPSKVWHIEKYKHFEETSKLEYLFRRWMFLLSAAIITILILLLIK